MLQLMQMRIICGKQDRVMLKILPIKRRYMLKTVQLELREKEN